MKLVTVLAALLVAGTVGAADSSPFGPDLNKALKSLQHKQIKRVSFDVAVDSGAVGAHALVDSYLPANAIITRSYYYIASSFSDSGTGTVALSCEDAGNILVAKDLTSYATGALRDGEQSGVGSVMVGSIASPCQITATVSGTEQRFGKLIAFIEYVIGE